MTKKMIIVGTIMLLNLITAKAATVAQTVQFNNVTPERLYEVYLSSAEHSAFTGAPAIIDNRIGGSFSAYNKGVTGELYQLEPGKLIVQKWRGAHFKPTDLDTTLVLTFSKNDAGAQIEVVQANVPDDLRSQVNTHWNLLYWTPMKDYVSKHPVEK